MFVCVFVSLSVCLSLCLFVSLTHQLSVIPLIWHQLILLFSALPFYVVFYALQVNTNIHGPGFVHSPLLASFLISFQYCVLRSQVLAYAICQKQIRILVLFVTCVTLHIFL